MRSLLGNYDETVYSVRGALVRYSSCITVRFKTTEDVSSQLLRLADELMASAAEYTDSPVEGDYIRYQSGGYESSYTVERAADGWNNVLKIVPKYYSYLEYEEKVTEKVREIINGFGFDENTTDYEKVRTVYDYVCRNVTYDMIHVRNDNYFLRSTSYAALIWGNATCQGCVFCIKPLRRVTKSAGQIVASVSAAVLVFMLFAYALPSVLAYPFNFTLNGASIFSTAFIYRFIGWLLGIILCLLICLVVLKTAKNKT